MSPPHSAAAFVLLLAALAATSAVAQESDAARVALDRAVAFAGGADHVYGMNTLVVSSLVQRTTEDGSFAVPTRTYYAFPLKVRHEIVVNGRTLAIASAPGGGALFTDDGALPLDEAARVGIERTTMRHPLVLLKARLGRGFRAEHAGVERVEGRDADLVRVTQMGNETVLVIDRDDGRLVEIRYQLAVRNAQPRAIAVRFYEWMLERGVRSPRSVQGLEQGHRAFSARVERIEVDEVLPDSLFTAGVATAGYGLRP